MRKRGRSLYIYNVACFEIVLLISFSFAVAFILEGGVVSGQEGIPGLQDGVPLVNGKIPTVSENGPIIDTIRGDIITIREDLASLRESIPTSGAKEGAKKVGEEGIFDGFKNFVKDIYGGKFGTESLAGYGGEYLGALVGAAAWAGTAYGIVKLVTSLFGLDRGLSDALSNAAAATVGSYQLVNFLVKNFGGELAGGELLLTGIGAVGVGVLVFVLTYKKESKQLVTYECLPFEPPLGGANCEDCNKDPLRPCSEYRCKSLGQACELLNPGSGEEKCAWVNPKDVTSPTISAWNDALRPRELNYIPDSTIRPPNRGVKVVTPGGNGCLQAFTPFEFGVVVNEPAQCKIDYNHTAGFDNMKFYFGGSNFHRYNHTQKMKLPGPDDSVGDIAPELKNDGFFSLFVRCRDPNGNENVDEFVFNFCVDPSEDTTPPRIEGTSILSGSPIRNDAETVPIEVYVNEPAECKWSRSSKNYDDMENKMNCATETYQINADLNYVCSGDLTITEKGKDNNFYFRCKDNPGKEESKRNVMVQSEELILKGSEKLNILNAGPNGTIFSSTETAEVTLNVRTDDGAEEGKAICYFSNSGEINSYIPMFETNSFEHKQKLDLVNGDYEYFFRCIDLGGNTAEAEVKFNVFIDKYKPIVTRAYKEDGLKIVTDEDAECVYSLSSCNYKFDEGLKMIYSNPSFKKQHFVEWKSNSVYYIKCKDLYGNGEENPNDCNIVVKSVELEGGNS